MINPVLITLIGAIIVTAAITFTYFPPGSDFEPEPINPVQGEDPNDPVGTAGISLANALIYVTIVLVGGVIFVVLLKYGLSRILEVVLGLTMGFSAFLFTVLILPAFLIPFFNTFDFLIPLLGSTQTQVTDNFQTLIFLLAILIAIIYVFGLIFNKFKNQHLHNTLMILFGISMGSIFGIFFETISLIVVLVALALYDIYAVFRGPLKSMFENINDENELNIDSNKVNTGFDTEKTVISNDEGFKDNNIQNTSKFEEVPKNDELLTVPSKTNQNLMKKSISLPIYTTPYISIGLGDFVFFSVLISKATYFALKGDDLFLSATTNGAIYWALILFPLIGIVLGSYLTFILLQKHEILPALPFPIFCGLIALFLSVGLYLVF
jgi:presenilin-like A22 family membrane protease